MPRFQTFSLDSEYVVSTFAETSLAVSWRQLFDVREWNDEITAYIRPLNGFEQLVFNDLFLTFYDKSRSYEERFNAGFEAAKMALVMEDDAPLLTDEDAETMRNASVVPFYRLFNTVFNSSNMEIETAKKTNRRS